MRLVQEILRRAGSLKRTEDVTFEDAADVEVGVVGHRLRGARVARNLYHGCDRIARRRAQAGREHDDLRVGGETEVTALKRAQEMFEILIRAPALAIEAEIRDELKRR